MFPISHNVTQKPLTYFEVLAARLPSVTIVGLQAAGISIDSFGLRVGQNQRLSSCFSFTGFAPESMPPTFGGFGELSRLGQHLFIS